MFFLAKFIRDKAAKLKKDHISGEDEKPFLDHLEDLRKTLFKIIITVMVVTIGTFIFNKQLLSVIQFPLYMANIPPEARFLQTIGPVEGMMLAIKVSFYAGIILSFPLLSYFLGEFILPGLKDNEKKLVLPSLFVGAGLFVTGICFSYFVVIPRAIEFFYNFSIERGWDYDLRSGYYISFAVQMVLVFGVSFELPVVVMALVKLEILSHRVMVKTRSTAVVVMVVVSAVITPTTDIFTLSFLAVPLILLYEICIWLAWWLEKKRAREEEAERKRSLPEAVPMPEPDPTDPGSGASTGAGDGGDASSPGPAALPITDTSAFDSDHLESTSPNYDSDNEFKPDEGDQDDDDFGSAHKDDKGADTAPTETPDESPGQDDSDTSHASSDHGDSGDDYWNDPYHHDYHQNDYHHDDYYSGPTEELKRSLREELTQQIKAELRIELLAELRKELRATNPKPRNMSLDPRRTRRPR